MQNELKPCPFCGGKAEVSMIEIRSDITNTTIICSGCRVTLEWTQEFYTCEIKDPISGELLDVRRVPHNESAYEAWNRRIEND